MIVLTRRESLRIQVLLLATKMRNVTADYRDTTTAVRLIADHDLEAILGHAARGELCEFALVADRQEGTACVRLARWEGMITPRLNRLLPPHPRPPRPALDGADFHVVATTQRGIICGPAHRVRRDGRVLATVATITDYVAVAVTGIGQRSITVSRHDVRRHSLTVGSWITCSVAARSRATDIELIDIGRPRTTGPA